MCAVGNHVILVQTIKMLVIIIIIKTLLFRYTEILKTYLFKAIFNVVTSKNYNLSVKIY